MLMVFLMNFLWVMERHPLNQYNEQRMPQVSIVFMYAYRVYSDTATETTDLYDVVQVCWLVASKWRNIGLVLGLNYSQLRRIEKESGSIEDCLIGMLTLWLQKNYNTEKYGEPSWELLAAAVADPAGGNNPALAKDIIHGHGGNAKD